jgi:hypothetical protein
VPTVQTIHILSIAAVVGSVLMINLRLLDVAGRDQPLKRFFLRAFLPVIWWTLPILLVTGVIMIVGEPVRSLENPVFPAENDSGARRGCDHARLSGAAQEESRFLARSGLHRAAAVVLVLVSFAIWIGIVMAGRWIAYF